MHTRRLNVGVVFGGRSCEHEVSLRSARSILSALPREHYHAIPIGITPEGRWVALSDEWVLNGCDRLEEESGSPLWINPAPPPTPVLWKGDRSPCEPLCVDIFFPIVHGTFGEDGALQGLFEMLERPYVGSGVLGCALSMDKVIMKQMLAAAGLPVAPFVFFSAEAIESRDLLEKVRDQCGAPPWFVKPANMGSSVGIHKVYEAKHLMQAVVDALRYDHKVLVEQAVVPAVELEVAVLGNEIPEASVAGQIESVHDFYDYAAKYLVPGSRLLIPATVSSRLQQRLSSLAIDCFKVLNMSGMARVDFLIRTSDNEPYILEANSLPGFTTISMYPKLWQATGLEYPQLLNRLIDLALKRHRSNSNLIFDYSGNGLNDPYPSI